MAEWNQDLTQLNKALAVKVIFPQEIVKFVTQAGIPAGNIDFGGAGGGASLIWFNVLKYTNDIGKVEDLVREVLKKYPDDPYLLAYLDTVKTNYDLGPDIKDKIWKGPAINAEANGSPNLEKIIEEESTLLPIHFLARGIERSHCVARIAIPVDDHHIAVGTGFLTTNNILITNNHVIESIAQAKKASIFFKYEETARGLPLQPKVYKLAPEEAFITSADYDCTAVKVIKDPEGDPELKEPNEEFGSITLQEQPDNLKRGDFVNIIQHPGGRHKQIGLYHNVVAYADQLIVQYLTDTEPGSSGSPVFNSNWEVVALHNSGGMLLEPHSAKRYLRNQGININKVIGVVGELL